MYGYKYSYRTKNVEPPKPVTVTKIEEKNPMQNPPTNEVKAYTAKLEVVEKFEMPVEDVKIPQKQDKYQNFMDALDSSFGESNRSNER